ncbi:kynureninase [Maricaulis parjimensis]|uniref:kynureninase n=1 Tax=Maricaulis parjimensis TaxID=144023 RepID=UPI00193A0388|nr:kynureninase [Maricaulis parjimensis]
MRNLEEIQRLDAEDPLAAFRDRFELPAGMIYLDGNSLGVMPKSAPAKMKDVVETQWGQHLITSWNRHDWIGLPRRLGGMIAGLIGAKPEEVVVADSTSINIFKALSAALQLNPDRSVILSESGNFPTNVYMMQGLSANSSGSIRHQIVPTGELETHFNDDVAALLITQAHYKTGYLHDMQAITKAAQEKGILVIWDLCHSAGALPIDLNACNADMAVGCGYKYLNGGPGAPAFIFVAERHQEKVMPVLSGWLGHAHPFDFSDQYEPAPGIDRFKCSSPSILGMSALECGLEIAVEADMTSVRMKSVALTELFIEQVEARLDGHGFELASPRDPAIRGSQVSFHHENGYPIMQALIDHGVIGDFRDPDILRFGFTPLYTSYEDVWRAAEILQDIMESGAWREARYSVRAAVT